MEWAEKELELFGYSADDKEDGPNKWMYQSIMDLMKVFCDEGHSGSSAPHAIALFTRLASWKPLSPLTGEDDEWNECDENRWQNNRASNVFKNEKGEAWDIDGITFWEWYAKEDGTRSKVYFTDKDSSVPVTFPYTVPDKPIYKERPSE